MAGVVSDPVLAEFCGFVPGSHRRRGLGRSFQPEARRPSTTRAFTIRVRSVLLLPTTRPGSPRRVGWTYVRLWTVGLRFRSFL